MRQLKTHWPDIRFSSLYATAPREHEEQDAFVNAVAVIQTDLSPEEIARVLQTIEHDLGKNPPFQFGPRTIDLDILLYGDEVLRTKELTIPHPRMHERRFVLDPLCELLETHKMHPTQKQSWGDLLQHVMDQQCTRLDEKTRELLAGLEP